jgi:hypothetical protein
MRIAQLTSRDAVEQALNEFDLIGQEAFLRKYGFGKSNRFFLVRNGRRYDSKAIVGAALGYQFPEHGAIDHSAFGGGEQTVQVVLKSLWYEIEVVPRKSVNSDLELNQEAFDRMAERFVAYCGDFGTFEDREGVYWQEERRYKDDMAALVASELTPAVLVQEASEDSDAQLVHAVLRALRKKLPTTQQPQNVINWRYYEFLTNLDSAARAHFATAFRELLTAEGDAPMRVESFTRRMWPIYERNWTGRPLALARIIPTFFLWLREPRDNIAVRTDLFKYVGRELTGTRVLRQAPMSAHEYEDVLSLSRKVFELLERRGWLPRDFIDVHSFLWIGFRTGSDEGEE